MKKERASQRREKREEKKSKRIPLKKYTKGGRLSSIMGVCNLLVIVATIAISIIKNGNAGIYVGLMMFAVLISAAIGFIIGINSFKEENKFLRFTHIGTIMNAMIWIGILGIYLIYV